MLSWSEVQSKPLFFPFGEAESRFGSEAKPHLPMQVRARQHLEGGGRALSSGFEIELPVFGGVEYRSRDFGVLLL